MLEIFKKIAFTGMGLIFLTKEKAEEMARELVEKGKFTEQEGREFIDDLKKASEQARVDFEEKINDLVHKAVTRMNLATRDDLERLEKRIEEPAAADDQEGADS
ncbi:MAG: hypothetical protein L3J03_09360 [Desulfobacterales bacterium]|nr:hypothetical protein [Desulfobacterales bacterium]